MTFRTVMFALCQGTATDFAGNLSVISMLGPKIQAPDLPTGFAPYLVAAFEEGFVDGARSAGTMTTLTVTVQNPDGVTLFFNRSNAPLVSDLAPEDQRVARMQLNAQLPISIEKYGVYEFRMMVEISGVIEVNEVLYLGVSDPASPDAGQIPIVQG